MKANDSFQQLAIANSPYKQNDKTHIVKRTVVAISLAIRTTDGSIDLSTDRVAARSLVGDLHWHWGEAVCLGWRENGVNFSINSFCGEAGCISQLTV